MTLKDINADIVIMNCQQTAEEETVIKQESPCGFYIKDEKIYIVYQEQEAHLAENVKTLIKIEKGNVKIRRSGTFCTTIKYEEGKKDNFSYIMPYGVLHMEVNTAKVVCDFDENGGKFYLEYELKVNGDQTLNRLTAEVKMR